ncbi:carbonic anhydrase [Paenibacillus sp. PastF-1]|nr:carbonic anhydrase [Paenibacillus sp. PastF-2]MDF9854743.1 carbonic anhydrase [Paenibacillus sp. PastF-1]
MKADDSLSPLKVEYSPSPVSIINNGHTIQVNLHNQDNKLTIEGKTYLLQQFHFHLPSEHEVDGKHAEMELHLVHKSEDGSLTTPPCTEGVQWTVLENPVTWSGEQIGKFAAIFPHDNRPVQPLGSREIGSDE